MATRKPRRFGSGGETADKEEGLKASKDEKVGFFERMRMGNIDQEGSEAYNRFGAGRGKAERAKNVDVEDRVATPVNRGMSKSQDDDKPSKGDDKPSKEMLERGVEEGKKKDSAYVAEMYSGPRTTPIESTPAKAPTKPAAKPTAKPAAKTEPKAPVKTSTSNYSNEGRSTPTAKKDTSNYSNESRGREMTKEQQFKFADEQARSPEGVARRKKMEKDQAVERVYPEEMLIGGPGLKGIQQLAKKAAGTTAPKAAGSRALSTSVDDGVTYLGKSGRRQVGGFDEVGSSGARQLANNPTRQLPAPPKQLSGPSKRDLVSRDRAARQAKRRSEMGEENASRYGLDTKSSDYADRAKSIRDNLGGDDFTLGMKRGGKVKSSASKPAAKGWGMARGARAAKMR
jgi:hypothetical protein